MIWLFVIITPLLSMIVNPTHLCCNFLSSEPDIIPCKKRQCAGQKNRVTHGKYGTFPEEGWTGPCGRNEATCHVSGYGDEGLLSLDWKHFPYEVDPVFKRNSSFLQDSRSACGYH